MTPTVLFYCIIGILVFDFLLNEVLSFLNYTWYSKPIPAVLSDVYKQEEYEKSQAYKKERFKFGTLNSFISIVGILVFIFLDGFALVDQWCRSITNDETVVSLLFFGVLFMASDLLTTPLSYYSTFVIEEKYGFNKTTKKLFFLDKIKGWFMTLILGGGLLTVLILIYNWADSNFWWYAWIVIFIVSILLNMFYARLIVPIFNKQAPLEQGSLRDKISEYANQVGFELTKIFVIDGSKRSTKANAYFSGFGSEKRVTLYDTLIDQLTEEEIVAVLAHEVGHYKKKHILYNLLAGTLTTGFTLYLFSLVVDNDLMAQALGVSNSSFHIGLVAFFLLYSPISMVTSIFMNILSRKFEYQADAYAVRTYKAAPLITGLKTLTKTSLSNLTPHPAVVWFQYSHPSLLQRITAMQKIN